MADRRGVTRLARGRVRLAILGGFVLIWCLSGWFQFSAHMFSKRAGLLIVNWGPGGSDFEVVDYPVQSPLWTAQVGTWNWDVHPTRERALETWWLTTEATQSWRPFTTTASAPLRALRGRYSGIYTATARIVFVPHWCVFCLLIVVMYGGRVFRRRGRRVRGGFEVVAGGEFQDD